MVVAAFGSGHLRIYEAANLALRTEVAAHSRWITGLDVASDSLLLVSCSEDSTFSVWQLNSEEENKVWKDCLECVRFQKMPKMFNV